MPTTTLSAALSSMQILAIAEAKEAWANSAENPMGHGAELYATTREQALAQAIINVTAWVKENQYQHSDMRAFQRLIRQISFAETHTQLTRIMMHLY